MKIGNIKLENGLFLGPMAGVTDKVYRLLCQEQGCDMTFTEMVSAKAIYYNNEKTETLMDIYEDEKNVGLQLFGRDPELISEMAAKVDNDKISSFDVNMGCPVPKVFRNGEGSALLQEPELIGHIVKKLKNRLNKPISIKIRVGVDNDHINVVKVCQIAQENGVDFISIHGRTREQYYSGRADWSLIRQAKEAVAIPVIGNGDITSGKEALRMLKETGCDGIMVGRAAMGNPWIFSEIKAELEGKTYIAPSTQEVVETIRRHGRLLTEYKGEYVAMREMRKHVSWYTKGMRHSTKLRGEINKVEKLEDLDALVEKVLLTTQVD